MKKQTPLQNQSTGLSFGKKLFITAVIAAVCTVSAFATTPPDIKSVNAKALSSLNYEFKNATNIVWKVTSGYIEAAFTWNGQRMKAFYNMDEDFVGTSTDITKEEFPQRMLKLMCKEYDGYKMTEAIEFKTAEGLTTKYASLENGEKKVMLQVDENDNVSVFKP